jgi:hypothetical protein
MGWPWARATVACKLDDGVVFNLGMFPAKRCSFVAAERKFPFHNAEPADFLDSWLELCVSSVVLRGLSPIFSTFFWSVATAIGAAVGAAFWPWVASTERILLLWAKDPAVFPTSWLEMCAVVLLLTTATLLEEAAA